MDIQVSAPGRRRAGWWAVGGVSLGIVALFLYAFVGTFVSGLFVYYAARPLHRRLERRLTKTLAATTTVLVLVLPGLLVLGYAAVVAFRELAAVAGPEVTRAILTRLALDSGTFSDLLRDPVAFLVQFERLGQLQENLLVTLRQFGVVVRGVVHLTLALAFAFFLYRDGSRLEGWFANEIGGKGTSVYAFVEAIDRDLEAVYFGNLLTVLIVTGFAVLVYNGFNAAVPPALRLPVPTLLALLTGLATFVPLVVGKLVYLPATGYLVWETLRTGAGNLGVPAAFLGASFVLLDILPQSLIRPYVAGRTLHMGLVLFSYVLGTALFGWYGLFYGPLLAIVVVQFANVAFPELVRGDDVTAATAAAVDIGTDPPDADGTVGDGAESDDDRAA
ncbi:AI-2E family transporter [Salinirarus marinus]|uniref:AI-2E family transporter n=1 Tax=Salinirarus marinus TaxID=3068310 RepID=UPI003C6C5D73